MYRGQNQVIKLGGKVLTYMSPMYLWTKIIKKLRGRAIINSKIAKTSKIHSGSHIVNSSMGRYSYCGYDCQIINCEIGSFCSIANNVSIGASMHPIEWVSTSPVFRAGRDSIKIKYSEHEYCGEKKTIIGHDVWIGERSLIKQGVTIGTGSIIGMGSVVTKDIEPYSIVAGCPAKLIRKRFDNSVIKKMFITQWWNKDDDWLKRNAEYFNDINKINNLI